MAAAKVRVHHWESLLRDGEGVAHDVSDYEHAYDFLKEVLKL